MSLDDIHENTYQWINEQQNALKDIAIAKAKKDGLVFDIDGAMNSNIYRAVVRALFQEFDPIEHKEQLFLLKLEMFEQDIIKNCKDRELKRKLRKKLKKRRKEKDSILDFSKNASHNVMCERRFFLP